MAVTGIRKVSSYTFLVLALVSLVVFAVFLFGGYEIDAKDNKVYAFTDLLLYWTYFLGIATLLTVLGFVFKNLAGKFATSPKDALKEVAGVLGIVVLLGLTYAVGSTTPLKLNADAQAFNSPGWLKVADMWLYTIYVLLFCTVCAAIGGSIKGFLSKR